MKKLWIFSFIAAFLFFSYVGSSLAVAPTDIPSPMTSTTNALILRSKALISQSGTYPLWPYEKPRIGQNLGKQEVLKIIPYLIACESGGNDIRIIDTNGLPSEGILMFQPPTWSDFEKYSGLVGSPMNEDDAVQMAIWAIQHGYLYRWSCAYKTHILSQ